MSPKFCGLMLLSLAMAACAHPLERAASSRAAMRQAVAEKNATIAGGACDDVGQLIVTAENRPEQMTLEASAAPHRR